MGNDTGQGSAGTVGPSEGMGEQVQEVHAVLHELALILGAQSAGLARVERLERDVEALRQQLATEVVTRRVTVLDDHARDRVRVDAGVTLIDPGGVERVCLTTGLEHGQIALNTTDPETFAAWSAGEDLHSAEIELTMHTGNREAISLGVDAGELAPGKGEIDPACRLRGLDGPYRWIQVDGVAIDEQPSMVADAVGAAKKGLDVAERCFGLVQGMAEEVVTRRLPVVDE